MAAVANLRPIHRVRLSNLRRIIDEDFGGNASECARKIKRSHTFMWQLVKGYRTIGEESARHIEKRLGLAANALDSDGTSMQHKLVPLHSLDDIEGKALGSASCPDARCADDSFCVEASATTGEDMVEIQAGDRVFVERMDKVKLMRVPYVIVLKRVPKKALILVARERAGSMVFATTNSDFRPREIPAADVRVIGRVTFVVRTL